MNIVKRIINNVKYAKYRKLRDKASKNVIKHAHDVDKTEFDYWKRIYAENLKKCIDTPLH